MRDDFARPEVHISSSAHSLHTHHSLPRTHACGLVSMFGSLSGLDWTRLDQTQFQGSEALR
jgi:hypothetical protein